MATIPAIPRNKPKPTEEPKKPQNTRAALFSRPGSAVYAVDFDGTLCENKFPDIGVPRVFVISYFAKLREEGNRLILWTCREGALLSDAVEWCREQGLEFDAVNENLPDWRERFGTDPRKIGANYYCDDKNDGLWRAYI